MERRVAVQTHGREVHPEGRPASCQACLESRRMLEGGSRCRPPTGSTPPRHLEGRRRGALQMGAVCTLQCLWQDMSPCCVTLEDSEDHVEEQKIKVPFDTERPVPEETLPWPFCGCPMPYAQCPELASRRWWPVLAISDFPLPRPINGPQSVKTCGSAGPIACCRAFRPNRRTHPIRFSSTRQLDSTRLFRAMLDATRRHPR